MLVKQKAMTDIHLSHAMKQFNKNCLESMVVTINNQNKILL